MTKQIYYKLGGKVLIKTYIVLLNMSCKSAHLAASLIKSFPSSIKFAFPNILRV